MEKSNAQAHILGGKGREFKAIFLKSEKKREDEQGWGKEKTGTNKKNAD